jgi:hypothetical protein
VASGRDSAAAAPVLELEPWASRVVLRMLGIDRELAAIEVRNRDLTPI